MPLLKVSSYHEGGSHHCERFATREEMRHTVFEYIEVDYNRTRRQILMDVSILWRLKLAKQLRWMSTHQYGQDQYPAFRPSCSVDHHPSREIGIKSLFQQPANAYFKQIYAVGFHKIYNLELSGLPRTKHSSLKTASLTCSLNSSLICSLCNSW